MSAVHLGKKLTTVPREAIGSAVFPRVRAHFGAATSSHKAVIRIFNMFDIFLADWRGKCLTKFARTNEEKAELTCLAKHFGQLLPHVYGRLLAYDSAFPTTTDLFV